MIKGRILLLSSPSGCGKTTIKHRLTQEHPNTVSSIVSHTTRPMRDNETNKVDYYFIDRDKFEKLAESGFFIETVEIHGELYGMAKGSIDEGLKEGKILVSEITYEGALAIKEVYPDDCITVFLFPESVALIKQRLFERGDSKADIKRRVKLSYDEIQNFHHYDYVLNVGESTSVESLIGVIINIIIAEMHRTKATLSKTTEQIRNILEERDDS